MSLGEDRYQNITLHHELIDWTDSSLTADSITRLLLGKQSHWLCEDFYETDPKTGEVLRDAKGEPRRMEPLFIEKMILFEGGRDNWHGESPYGKPYYQHFLTLMRLLFPETDISPSIADVTMFFCLGLGFKKILNLIGCQNASKSASAIRIAVTCMFIDPEYTAVYVANPFDNSADSTVWGDLEELWDELCKTFPHPTKEDVPSIFPKGFKYKQRRLEFIPGNPKAARAELRNVKKVGKYKGSKTRGKQTTRGVFIVIIDEINEIESHAFLSTLENLSSQDAFFGITSQNYKDPEDMGGLITAPVPTFGGPSSVEELDIEEDLYWHSAKASITLRLDGHRSANILATTKGEPPTLGEDTNMAKPRIIYPYLLKPQDLFRLSDGSGGIASLGYYSQIRSFPITAGEITTVLSQARVSASRHTDPHYSLTLMRGTVAFCDPAFGGRDAAIWGCSTFGQGQSLDGTGENQTQEFAVFRTPMVRIPLVRDAFFDDEWLGRLERIGADLSGFTPGARVSFEEQVAIKCAELNQSNGIPAENFGYDFSMRPDIVSAMNRIVGFQSHAFDYNGKPEGHFLESVKKDTTEYCKNRLSELAFLSADLFLTKQLRGGEHIPTAILQLQRTRYEKVNNLHLVEDKKKYKARWNNVSPDERDVLMGIAGMAHRRGFRKSSLEATLPNSTDTNSIWQAINKKGFGKARVKPQLR